MTTPTSPTGPASPTTDVCHCGHTENEHDPVALRYCRATLADGLQRTCTCPVGPSVAARSYDRR
jgi:hypothetical protein